MFLSLEWFKRWFPAVLLLLSLFLPWWTMIDLYATRGPARKETYHFRPFESFTLSFPWVDETKFFTYEFGLTAFYSVKFSNIPFLFLVSALILLGGLCGLFNERGTRTLGGLLGIGGFVFYFVWRLVFTPWYVGGKNFYFGTGEYATMHYDVGAVWFLSIGFYLAVIGSLMLLALSIGTPTETPKEPVFSVIKGVRRSIFLGIAWIKRRLPAVFLLLSLLLPWWTMIEPRWGNPFRLGNILFISVRSYTFYLSFPWNPNVQLNTWSLGLDGYLRANFYDIPMFCLVSSLIFVGGLCGFSYKKKIRSLGGLLSILGAVSFFILVFHKIYSFYFLENPYFGIAEPHRNSYMETDSTIIWFLSIGFYIALAGSLMLLLPLIRTLVKRFRKRL